MKDRIIEEKVEKIREDDGRNAAVIVDPCLVAILGSRIQLQKETK